MFRKILPLLTIFLAMLLDTAIIPVFYHGTYIIPLTLATTLCIGLLKGQLWGLLYGMIGGLLIDITTGTLGIMAFFFMSAGLLVSILVNEYADRKITGIRFHLRRAGVAFILMLVGEIVLAFYQYFITANFEWFIVRNLFVRSGLMAVLVVALCPLLDRLFHGRKRRSIDPSNEENHREVKHF